MAKCPYCKKHVSMMRFIFRGFFNWWENFIRAGFYQIYKCNHCGENFSIEEKSGWLYLALWVVSVLLVFCPIAEYFPFLLKAPYPILILVSIGISISYIWWHYLAKTTEPYK